MPTGPLLRRPSSALIGLLALALSAGLGAAWLSGPCAVLQPELNTGAPIEAEGTLPMLAAPIESSAQPQASARVELDPGTQTQSPLTQDAGLRLRFVRGSTGKSAGVLGVRLLETSEDGDSLPVEGAGALLAEGRSDTNGWFEAPASARIHAFKIELDAGDGVARTALPTLVRPRMLPADGSGFEVEVLGAWASFEALVLDAGGAPVSGASVQFDFESPAFAFSLPRLKRHDALRARALLAPGRQPALLSAALLLREFLAAQEMHAPTPVQDLWPGGCGGRIPAPPRPGLRRLAEHGSLGALPRRRRCRPRASGSA